MSKVVRSIAKGVVTAGLFVGAGSCAADIATCPGEVDRISHEVPAMYCDEDPSNDDFLNNPGTPEQKLMYGGFGIALAGGLILWLTKNEDQTSLAPHTELS